jgi:phenylpyruvate tautomerase PptA (4-oxalocrotonate tautomerase family)
MPLMHVLLTPNAFDDAGKARLVQGLTEAACRAESVPDLPAARMRALVMIEELPADGFYSAGKPGEALVCGVFLTWKVSTGVLDAARKEAFAKEIQAVAEEAAPADGRLIVTSAVIEEVPEGQWAQSGQIRRLPEVAAIAQLQHLASIAERRDRKDAA